MEQEIEELRSEIEMLKGYLARLMQYAIRKHLYEREGGR